MRQPADTHIHRTALDGFSIASGSRVLTFIFTICTSTLVHSATLELPSLGNSAETDKKLSQEIDDNTVYRPVPAPLEPEPIDTAASTPSVPHKAEPLITVWDRIRLSEKIPLNDSERVQFYKQQYINDALWVNKILQRSTPFMAHLVKELEDRFLPPELALLPAIESGYQPDVVSQNSAAGLWQIVPVTAKEIGVHRTRWFDGRADIVVSTTAAMDYLSYLNAEFNGDWELTLAAYNAGPGRVRAAVKKNAKASLPTTFSELELPDETREYLPKFVALVQLIKDTEQRHLELPELSTTVSFTQVDAGQRISLDKAASISDIPETTLRSLNAGLVHGVTDPRGPHVLYVPNDSADAFTKAIASASEKGGLYSLPRTHTVVAGDTLSDLAEKYGMTQKRLKDINSLDNANIKIGQKLAVVDTRHLSDESIVYTVGPGDTLSGIAEKFSVKVGDISDNSGAPIQGELIRPGDRLTIVIKFTDAS